MWDADDVIMMCTDCDFTCDLWLFMKNHYREKHPDITPYKYFTQEAKAKK